ILTGVTPVSGSNNTQFDITFTSQSQTGLYKMVIGPNITDTAGHQMDQNANFKEGETPDDQFTVQFGLLGPKITASTPSGNNNAPGQVKSVRVTFNESMNPATFDASQVSFFGPPGRIPVTGVTPVTGTNNTQFDISFSTLNVTGPYYMVIGPNVKDMAGNAMDQNGNFIPGEDPGDQYITAFRVFGPRATATKPTGHTHPPNP